MRRQRRGGVAIAAPAPARRELTEEEAKAKYDADLAEAIRRSIDTVQPASVEYAEAWSAAQAGIINVEHDDPPPAAGEVKTEEPEVDRKSTRLNSSHSGESRMPSSA